MDSKLADRFFINGNIPSRFSGLLHRIQSCPKDCISVERVFHELGHACAALLLKKKAKVRVYLGRHGEQPTVALGRLEIYAGPASSFWGTCEVESELNSFQTVIISAAGPLVSLLLAVLGFVVLFDSSAIWELRALAGVFFYANTKQFFVTAVPKELTHPHSPEEKSFSDGLKIVNALVEKQRAK